jgi:hypothetical protein
VEVGMGWRAQTLEEARRHALLQQAWLRRAKTCECGCGVVVRNRFVRGHNRRFKK